MQDGRTPLHYGAQYGSVDTLKPLVAMARRPDGSAAGGPRRSLPLHLAAGRPSNALPLAQLLLPVSGRDCRLARDSVRHLQRL